MAARSTFYPASPWTFAAQAVPAGLAFLAVARLLHFRVLGGTPTQHMTLFHQLRSVAAKDEPADHARIAERLRSFLDEPGGAGPR